MQLLRERWVLTLAQDDPGPGLGPYPTPLFFAVAEPGSIGAHEAPILVVISDPSSHHGRLAGLGPAPVAAGVYLETEDVGQLRGVQLRGQLIRAEGWTDAGLAGLRATYLGRHPMAAGALADSSHQLYGLIMTWAKTTDNRLGFGVHGEHRFDAACSEVKQSPGE